jgi:hypothetical protein
MSPTSYRAAPPRVIVTRLLLLATSNNILHPPPWRQELSPPFSTSGLGAAFAISASFWSKICCGICIRCSSGTFMYSASFTAVSADKGILRIFVPPSSRLPRTQNSTEGLRLPTSQAQGPKASNVRRIFPYGNGKPRFPGGCLPRIPNYRAPCVAQGIPPEICCRIIWTNKSISSRSLRILVSTLLLIGCAAFAILNPLQDHKYIKATRPGLGESQPFNSLTLRFN